MRTVASQCCCGLSSARAGFGLRKKELLHMRRIASGCKRYAAMF